MRFFCIACNYVTNGRLVGFCFYERSLTKNIAIMLRNRISNNAPKEVYLATNFTVCYNRANDFRFQVKTIIFNNF